MIRLMIVAGEETTKVVDYLADRGSFEVKYSVNSLSESEYEIKNSIIQVDKLVFIFNGTDTALRKELDVLCELMRNESFFNTQEILFIHQENELTKRLNKFFEVGMASVNFQNYNIKVTKGKFQFAEIYKLILGVTTLDETKSVRKKVFLVENDSDSNKAYIGDDVKVKLVEPFKYANLDKYNKSKKEIINLDNGITHIDNEVHRKKYPNPNLGRIDIAEDLSDISTFVVTGQKKTGKSIWSIVLSLSAKEAGNKVLLVDFTDNSDITDTLNHNKIDYKDTNMLGIIRGKEYLNKAFNVCTARSDAEKKVRKEFLQVLNYQKNQYKIDKVIVVCEDYYLNELASVFENKLKKVFITFSILKSDVTANLAKIIDIQTRFNVILLLSNIINLMPNQEALDLTELRSYIPNGVKLVKPKIFEDFDVDDTLNEVLLEGEDE